MAALAAHGLLTSPLAAPWLPSNTCRGQKYACRPFCQLVPDKKSGRGPRGLPAAPVRAAVGQELRGAVLTSADVGKAERREDAQNLKRTEEEEKFEWAANWYPVALERDLDKRVPFAVTILGRPVVLWWDSGASSEGSGTASSTGSGAVSSAGSESPGQWRAFWDACPHRLAPLSEGRIDENGNLQCSYHGWSFSGSGGCENIPQAENPTARLSKRACATPYPTLVKYGMVWVFPEPYAFEKALKNPPPSVPELDDPSFYGELVMREFPYGYEMLAENLLDASHLPFAHHNLIGKRDSGKPIDNRVTEKSPFGFEGVQGNGTPWTFAAPTLIISRMKFPPPSEENGDHPLARQMSLVFWVTPVAPGRSRLFFSFPQNFVTSLMRLIPRFAWHIGNMPVLDSDLMLLHGEERRLAEKGTPALRAMYLPSKADRFVAAFREWLTNHAGGGPDFGPGVAPGPPPERATREQLMDRYTSHVSKCKSCSAALRNFRNLQTALAFGSVATVGGVAACTAARVPLVNKWGPPALLLALAMAGGAAGLEPLIKKFYFEDYVHALIP